MILGHAAFFSRNSELGTRNSVLCSSSLSLAAGISYVRIGSRHAGLRLRPQSSASSLSPKAVDFLILWTHTPSASSSGRWGSARWLSAAWGAISISLVTARGLAILMGTLTAVMTSALTATFPRPLITITAATRGAPSLHYCLLDCCSVFCWDLVRQACCCEASSKARS